MDHRQALYAIWLCAAFDDQSVEPDVVEPPVPGGLADCLDAFGPVLEFFGLDPLMLAAASEEAPSGVKEPNAWLREATKLVDQRGRSNYQAAAEILADLCEAVGGAEGEKITHKHAAHLAKKHPTLTHLKSSLRKRGLLE